MAFESSRDRLRWTIEHDSEYFRKWHTCKSAISWTRKNQDTFSLLFGHLMEHGDMVTSNQHKIGAIGRPGGMPGRAAP
jgi:hypothetical protein